MKKTTSQKLSKKLTKYGALTLALAGVSSVNGQIIYHDVDPDFDGSSDYFLNLNPIDDTTPDSVEDAVNDFRLLNIGSVPSSAGLQIELLNSNASIIGSSATWTYPFALNSGYTISNGNSNWLNEQFQTLAYVNCSFGSSNWCNISDKYLGLQFNINGDTHYGWVKLDVDVTGTIWSVKEYAFNMTPDEAINAGQKTLGIDGNIFSVVKIIALNKTIALYNLPQETDYKLFNMSGQSILKGKIKTNTHVIEANTLSSGIYIIELKEVNSEAIIRKKIIL